MYEIEGLEQGIEKAKENIKIFEDAISRELQTIAEYKEMITVIKAKEKARKEDSNGNSGRSDC